MGCWKWLPWLLVLLGQLLQPSSSFWASRPRHRRVLQATAPEFRDKLHRTLVEKTQEALRLPPGPERSSLIRRAMNFALKLRDPYALTIYSCHVLPAHTKLKTKEYHALLNLCSSPELVDIGKKIFNDMVESGHAPQEPSFIFLVRACAQMGNPMEAFGVVHRMSARNVTIRLRTYKPILDELQESGDWDNFRLVWDHMETESGVDATDEQLGQAFDMLQREPELWAGENIAWLQSKLWRFSGKELCLQQATLEKIADSIDAANQRLERGVDDALGAGSGGLGALKLFRLEPKENICPACGAEIPRRTLDPRQREELMQGLYKIAATQGHESGEQNLRFFQTWLAKHTTEEKGGPFRVIIDAANVAYTRPLSNLTVQSSGSGSSSGSGTFASGSDGDESTTGHESVTCSGTPGSSANAAPAFKFEQIEQAVQWCKEANLRPLVVLSMKYSKESFTTGLLRRGGPSHRKTRLAKTQQFQRLTEKDTQLLRKWEDDDMLFLVNRGGNDDWYWMLACVSQTGQDPFFISNDQLRDHRLRLLAEHAFARWQANAQINFSFVSNPRSASPDLYIYEPPVWSREIHWDGEKRWHIPSSTHDWACVQMPTLPSEEVGASATEAQS